MSKERRVPQRMCVACREMRDKKNLWRVVKAPDGQVMIDPGGRSPGRGAYLCRNEECLKKAVKAHSLERALQSKISDEVYAALAAALKPDDGPAAGGAVEKGT